MQNVAIPLSRTRIIWLLAVAALFVIAGGWMFGMDAAEIEQLRRFNNPLLVHGIGVAAMAMGAVAGLAIGRKLSDPAPGLLLDAHGLTDNTSAFSAGRLAWSEISGFQVGQIQGQRLLYVMLKDPDACIARFGPVKQALLRVNQRLAASPVTITDRALKMDFDELVALLQRHFEAARLQA